MGKKVFSILVIVLVGLVAYINSFTNDFVWDDEFLIVNNELTAGFNLNKAEKILTQELQAGSHNNYYRPVQVFSYCLDYALHNLNPFGYHLTNFLIHILNAILVYFLVSSIMSSRLRRDRQVFTDMPSTIHDSLSTIPFLTALFWVVHPLHTEAVSYISGRADLLAVFFMLSAMLLYIRSFSDSFAPRPSSFVSYPLSSNFYLLSSVFCFTLALFSKEMSIIFPVFMISYGYFFRRQEKLSYRIKRLLPFLLIAFFYIFLRLTIIDFSSTPPWKAILFSPNNSVKIFSFLKSAVLYLWLLIMPVNLYMERFMAPARHIYDPGVLVSIFLTAAFFLIFKKFRVENRRFILFGISWFFIFLFPQSTFFFTFILADHFLYLPSIGLFFAFACGFDSLRIRRKTLARIIAIALIIFWGIVTFSQNCVWRDNFTFYCWTDKMSPVSFKTRNNLANIYVFSGEDDLAIVKYEQALRVNPNEQTINKNLVIVEDYLIKKYQDKARAAPHYTISYYNLAYLYSRKGRMDEAVTYYKKAIERNPRFTQAVSNLGNVYEKEDKFDQALAQYRQAIAIDPGFAQGYFNIGVVLANQGKLEEAEGYFTQALAKDPAYQNAKDYIVKIKEIRKKSP